MKRRKDESEGLCSLLRGMECRARKNGDKPAVPIGPEPQTFGKQGI